MTHDPRSFRASATPGDGVALVDRTSGKTLFELRTRADSTGKVSGVDRKLFGIRGDGLRLRAGRTYRVVAVYRNPLGHTLVDGGMAVLAGIFAPDCRRTGPLSTRAIGFSSPTWPGSIASGGSGINFGPGPGRGPRALSSIG